MAEKKKKQFLFKIKINFWTIALVLFLIFFVAPMFFAAIQLRDDANKVELSQLALDIKDKKVKKVLIENEKLIVTYSDDSIKFSTKEEGQNFTEFLERSGIDPTTVGYTVTDQSLTKTFAEIAGIVLPLVLMAAFFYYILRAQSRGAQDIFSFGRSKAKIFAKGKQDITFADVAGVDDAKKELEELVDFLKFPGKYRKMGARTPKGALLFGPAGVGKTLLAKAVAGEAGVPFFSMAGSEFMEMLVGVGASRVRDLFGQAKASAPSIIFIDEIDAIGRQRGRGLMGGLSLRRWRLPAGGDLVRSYRSPGL